MSRRLAYARLIRIPNVFTAIADVAIAWAIGRHETAIASWCCISAASACLYCAGMVWNDYFDRRVDAIERPRRPIPSGQIAPRTARRLATVLSILGLILATVAGVLANSSTLVPTLIASALLVLILAYDSYLKSTAFGFVAMGGCRFLNVLLGYSILPAESVPWAIQLATATVVGCYVAGITLFARDEATTSRQARLQIGAFVVLISALSVAAVPAAGTAWGRSVAVILVAGLIIVIGLQMNAAIRAPQPQRVQNAVKSAIMGLIVLDAALAVSLAGLVGLLLLALIVPAVVLGRWVYST